MRGTEWQAVYTFWKYDFRDNTGIRKNLDIGLENFGGFTNVQSGYVQFCNWDNIADYVFQNTLQLTILYTTFAI